MFTLLKSFCSLIQNTIVYLLAFFFCLILVHLIIDFLSYLSVGHPHPITQGFWDLLWDLFLVILEK